MTSPAKMMTIDSIKFPEQFDWRSSSVIASRPSALFVAAIGTIVILMPVRAHAQWWRSAPADFEACADAAEKAKTKEEKTSALAECNAKFAGRRKPGGGYTYYDFMQDRSFDIAGPNPTPDEQKYIDQQYALYLEKQRRSSVQAARLAKQQEEQLQEQQRPPLQQASLQTETERVPIPHARPSKLIDGKPRCPQNTFSCEWQRLSDTINDLKKLFGGTQAKGKKS